MRSSDVGITKQAVSAARMRYIVSSLPENLARKKLGKSRYDRIRSEIDNVAAKKRGITYDDGYATLIQPRLKSVFGGAPTIRSKGRYQNGNWLKGTTDAKDLRSSYQLDGEHWRDVKRSLFPAREVDSHSVVSRDDLIAMHRATNTPVNEGDFVHDYYFNLFPDRPTNPGAAAAAKAMRGGKNDNQLPSLDYMQRMVGAMRSLPYDNGGTWRAARNNKITRVAANDIQHAPGDAFTYIDSQGLLEKTPRSIKTTLSRLDGQNILEPGTRANALYTRLRSSNNPNLRGLINKVTGHDDAYVDLIERGGQAGYLPGAGVTMVSPKTKNYAHINAHERAHESLHKMAPAEHAAVVNNLAQRLRNVGVRNGLNIPWDNPKLMQEALADGYRMLKGGPGGSVDTGRLARWNLNADADAMKRIDNLVGASDVEKEMLRQLYVNYQHDIFNRASRLP
jgi:hypothetical protein